MGLPIFLLRSISVMTHGPFFEGWPMPDMLPVATVQKSYPVAVLVHFKSGYQAAHAAKSLRHHKRSVPLRLKAIESRTRRRLRFCRSRRPFFPR